VVDSVIDTLEIGREGRALMHHLTEGINRERVNRAKNGTRKAFRRGLLQGQVVPRAETGIDSQGDRERQSGLFIENRNLLLASVFLKREVFLRESGHGRAASIGDGDEDIDQLDIDFERGCGVGTGLGTMRRFLCRERKGQQREQTQKNDEQSHSPGFSHRVMGLYLREVGCGLAALLG